ncbi:hypothetical protein NIES4103_40170 [Nostoc sp. NIES-4103]|nr:hypothetical protein NIES4103_40170 [Nostoc sp. NIES-4103]
MNKQCKLLTDDYEQRGIFLLGSSRAELERILGNQYCGVIRFLKLLSKPLPCKERGFKSLIFRY